MISFNHIRHLFSEGRLAVLEVANGWCDSSLRTSAPSLGRTVYRSSVVITSMPSCLGPLDDMAGAAVWRPCRYDQSDPRCLNWIPAARDSVSLRPRVWPSVGRSCGKPSRPLDLSGVTSNPHLMYIWCNIYLFIYHGREFGSPAAGRIGGRKNKNEFPPTILQP
jgi:hypothetical protein